MTDTSKYMSILAKVMKTKNSSDSIVNKEKYNKLYYKIHSDFNNQLQKSLYPYTSDIVQKCDDMLDAMEPLFVCPEIIGKKCLLVSNHKTASIFEICNQLFDDKKFSSRLSKIYTQIPFIIVNTENENVIEIINYANVRVLLSTNEFKFLVIESGKRKIALNKIVQFVLIKTKLYKEDVCIISDNVYAIAEKTFHRVISQRIANIDESGVNTIEKMHLDRFAALAMSDSVISDIQCNPSLKKIHYIAYGEINGFVDAEVKQVLYGFSDEFLSINTQILDYYDKQIIQSKTTRQNVIGDIVRLEDTKDKTLQSIRKHEERREKKIESEAKDISCILKEIESLIAEISNDIGDNYIIGKQIPRYVLDCIFESFFRMKKYGSGNGKVLLSRLYSFEYDNYDLVSAYVQIVSGKKTSFEPIDIKPAEWEKAKMLLRILEPEKIPEQILRLYVDTLGDRCKDGNELFAKALIFHGYIQNKILQESFDKGYEKAGMMLLEKYKKGEKGINLLSLANALVPEACMVIANQKMELHKNDERRINNIFDWKFTYYKIAAAKQYTPAIAKIVDILFESRFSSGFQIPKDDLINEKYKGMIENGHLICKLCRFLLSKMYHVNHYNEVLGVTLFSLNENLSEAMSLLSNAKSPLACYCKGNMYEFGGGVAVDLDQAIHNYQKAIENGLKGRVEKRLDACKEKKSRFNHDESCDDYYQSTKTYHSSSTITETITVDDGCFAPGTRVLMTNGIVKNVEFLEIGDKVLVFDHYNGAVSEDIIVANVHDTLNEKLYKIVSLHFENDILLSIVKSHALFDVTENQYVLIDDNNVSSFVGHEFAVWDNNLIGKCKLLNYSIETRKTCYYMPLSRFHLNLFAEGILTIPPTNLTINLFNIGSNMRYDLAVVKEIGETSYKKLENIVSLEEYSVLPCKYLDSILCSKKCDMKDFEYVMALYRDQKKYQCPR